jgi:mono/diheme cytochrome c family protein
MKIIGVIALIVILAIAGVVAFSYSGLLDVAANIREPALVQWLLENTRKNSIVSRSKNITVPDITNEERWSKGGNAFSEICSSCHGAPGQKPFLGAGDMNPPPPDLADIVSHRTTKELFWVVKNGIRMTGMPAWGVTHTDEQIWDMVAFMKRLPKLSPASYQKLINTAQDDGHGHEHGEVMQSTTDDHNDDADHPH